MKQLLQLLAIAGIIASCNEAASTSTNPTATVEVEKPASDAVELYIDVHNMEPGKVNFAAVMDAHQKDLATQGKYGVQFQKFWVDEEKGKVYCLSSAVNAEAVEKTHKEAHGLVPAAIYHVTGGAEDVAPGNKQYFLDVHEVGPGNVTAAAVADAHKKDLAVQSKYGVHFVNYWVDEKNGLVMCLSQASDSESITKTHKEAHGLLPAYTLKVKQGE